MSDTETKPETGTTPIFGSAATFQSNSGFGGFSGIPAAPAVAPTADDGDGEAGEAAGNDEECKAEFTPVVKLDEVETTTGEEEEEAVLEYKCKLYRYDQENNEWKERGVGQVKLLKHKSNHRTRLLMRQEKTLKLRANFMVMPGTKLTEHAGNEKAWVWSCVDFSEGQQQIEMFAMRFGTVEKAQDFKEKFEQAMTDNAEFLSGEATTVKDESQDAANELAAEIEKTTVDDAAAGEEDAPEAEEAAAEETVKEEAAPEPEA